MGETNDDIWKDDLLKRREDAEWLATFLQRRSGELAREGTKRAFVLNLDSGWGRGKTFFLDRFRRQLEGEGHIAVYVNAWADDFAEDPLVAVMAAIDEAVKQRLPKRAPERKLLERARKAAGPVAREVGKGLFWRGVAFALTAGGASAVKAAIADVEVDEEATEVADTVVAAVEKQLDQKAEDAVGEFNSAKAAIANFRKRLAEFIDAVDRLEDVKPPFFVLVDELDRCRPPYAIAMLERIKHLFEIPNVVFVVATDSEQLVHSIKAVYGAGFSGDRYLARFFDRSYSFERPTSRDLVGFVFAELGFAAKFRAPFGIDPKDFAAHFFDAVNFEARAIERVLATLHAIQTTWPYQTQLELPLLLPLAAGFDRDRKLLDEPFSMSSVPLRQMFIGWSVTHKDNHGGVTGTKGMDIASQLFEAGRTFYRTLRESRRNNRGVDEYVAESMQEEMRALYSGRLPPENAVSVVREYPRIVRLAGRIDSVGKTEAD